MYWKEVTNSAEFKEQEKLLQNLHLYTLLSIYT